MKIREPAVAGKFYPSTEKALKAEIEQIWKKEKDHFRKDLAGKKIFGGLAPHAGYMFSAYQAAHLFELIKNMDKQPDTFVIIHPDHYGGGPGVALDENEAWETPLGTTELDMEMMNNLPLEYSMKAHQAEHAGEVMLPFLQYMMEKPFKIVPVSMTNQDVENARKLADAIIEAGNNTDKSICLIASSDFSHFVEPDAGEKLDNMVLQHIKEWNTQGVYDTILQNHITVCGYGPIMTLMEYTRQVAQNPSNDILARGHSGQVMPSNEVVDYVSMVFYDEG